jgi:hypothetical protein
MGLFAPWFLAGVAAVGLPVYIHLLKRHKTDPRMFPSLMFFEKREVSSTVHRRLDYILLFALRTAMLVLLALLFANPFINRAAPSVEGNHITVIAVDHSFSMRAGDRLARAKDQANSVINGLKPGSQAQVLALGGQVQAMTQLVSDPAELHAAVNAIQPSDGRASFGELSRYVRTLSESTHTPIQVDLASDLQKTGLPPGFTDLRLNQDTKLVLHQAGEAAPNWTVENVVVPSRIYDPKRVRIQSTIAGFGAPGAKKTVSLILNGKTLQTKTVDVPENGRASAEFLGLDAPYGFSKGEVRIESGDTLAGDDKFAFSVERTDPRKVLFIDTGRRPEALLYFRAALDASAEAAFVVESQRAEQAANAQLPNYAFVVLSDLGALPVGFEDTLKKYVNGGGSVLIALGPASAALPRVPVTEETIEAASYAGREGDRFLIVSDADEGHPALKGVERFANVKFYQAIHVVPSKSTILARLNNQNPLVLERKFGEGKVLTFTSTFDKVSNDLPLHAAWVPFIAQTARYLGGNGGDEKVNLPVDSYVELRAANSKGAAAEVLDPEGKRVLSLQEAATARNFSVNREGFFEVRSASGKHSLIAVNADRRESDLTPIPQETRDLWTATGSDPAPEAQAKGSQNQAEKRPWSLWPILLLLLLGVAVAESVVANRYLRPPVDRPESVRKEAA